MLLTSETIMTSKKLTEKNFLYRVVGPIINHFTKLSKYTQLRSRHHAAPYNVRNIRRKTIELPASSVYSGLLRSGTSTVCSDIFSFCASLKCCNSCLI